MFNNFKKENRNLNAESFNLINTQCNIGAYKQGIKQDQDRIIFPFKCSNITVCGVADGHGGLMVVQFLVATFPRILRSHLKYGSDKEKAIKKSITAFEQQVKDTFALWHDNSGSTLTLVCIDEENIFLGNLGDSRAVLCEDHNAIQLSEDHNLDNQNEKNRILKLIKDHYDYENLFNEVTNDDRIFGSKVTRSLCSISPQHITSNPYFTSRNICAQTQFIIIATDGIWDHMRNDEATCFVEHAISEGQNLQHIAEKLTNQCKFRGEEISNLPLDDMAVVIIQFKNGKKIVFGFLAY